MTKSLLPDSPASAPPFRPPSRLLILSGHDPSTGGGAHADARAAQSLGLLPFVVLSAVTAQDSHRITAAHPLPPELVKAQLELGLAHAPLAMKIGMLGSKEVVSAAAELLHGINFPIVLDPVARSTTGGNLMVPLKPESFAPLLPLVTLITPNIPETTFLTGITPVDEESARAAAKALCDMGPEAALLKGGHSKVEPRDYLYIDGALTIIEGTRLPGPNVRGTGCWLSTLIAARLANGVPLLRAVTESVSDLRQRRTGALRVSPENALLLP